MKCIYIPVKRRTITKCRTCPFSDTETHRKSSGLYCRKQHRRISDVTVIPHWCPLQECTSSKRSSLKSVVNTPESETIQLKKDISELKWMKKQEVT
jgi:hypothetical protein